MSGAGAAMPVSERLILAGIGEIEKNGIQGFSLRKAAMLCGVSCAAPYRHFKDKADFLMGILKYINEKWAERQAAVVSRYEGDVRRQLTEISLEYIRFLVENPHFRSIIMLKDADMDPDFIKMKSKLSGVTTELINQYCSQTNMSDKTRIFKTFVVRSLIYGAALMLDNGELEYTEKNFELVEKSIDREFDLDGLGY